MIALVTGANKSIGYEVVRALALRGMIVYLGSRDPVAGQVAASELAEAGDVRAVHLDTTDEATLAAVVETIGSAHGQLDVLVNNAGIAPGGGDAVTCPSDTLLLAMQTNAHGPAKLIQLATPLLRKSVAARVVNVSSGAGSMHGIANAKGPLASVAAKPYAYCLSKVAMNGMTVLFAEALRPDNIKVNAVTPGYVKSQVSRFMGTRTPEEGARVILQYATLDDDGPTGGFFDEKGPLPW